MRSLVCFKIFQKKTFSQCAFLVGLLACLALSVGFSHNASALSTTVQNPAVWYSRWWTSRATVPTITANTGELKQIPFDVLVSSDSFLIGNDNWFSLENNTILELTTFSGSFSYDFGAPQGGPLTNCHITIRLTTGDAVNPVCSIEENTVGANGGSITYKFSGSLPTNTGVARVDFNIGELNCTDAYSCALPLSAGRVRLKSFNMTIISENSASTTQILQKIDGVSSDLTIISDKLDTIISLLRGMGNSLTPAQIEQAIVDAQQQAREDERQELDSEASDYQGELEDNVDQQAIETKMSSILAIIEDFVFAIGRPVISTCILPMDFRAYTGAGFYEVDLCHLSPPSGITTVLNVVFIFFVLGLAYSAIRSVISMYKEVIDG